MKVVIIGSGNVAAVMGRLMHAAGHEIEQVWSRQEAHAASLAQLLGAAAVTDLKGLKPGAELYLLAVSDTGLESIAQELRLHNELIVHTAGAVSKEVLKPVSSRYGVLWPMKMIRKSMQTIDPVTMVVDGNTTATLESIEKIAGYLPMVLSPPPGMLPGNACICWRPSHPTSPIIYTTWRPIIVRRNRSILVFFIPSSPIRPVRYSRFTRRMYRLDLPFAMIPAPCINTRLY